jgi:hypothetical protein
MEILIEMIDAIRIERAGSPDEAVDFISLPEQKLGKIGTILAGDARD